MSFTDLLVHTCDIQRFTIASTDAHGNPVKTWANHYTAQACRISAMSGKQMWNGAQLEQVDQIIDVSGTVDITEEDRVVLEGVTYKVLLVDHAHDSTPIVHHYTVHLQTLRASGNP